MSQPVTYTGVVAMASDRGIGYRGALPWHLPDDLKTFKRLTTGHPVLMGRKTYESIGRPLPGRQNIVLTRDPFWTAEGVDVIHSVEELERLSLMDPEVMVIGGAEIFSLMMPLMSRMWISHVRGNTRRIRGYRRLKTVSRQQIFRNNLKVLICFCTNRGFRIRWQ